MVTEHGLRTTGNFKTALLENSNNLGKNPSGIWMSVSFADNGCQGSFEFGQGKTDGEEIQYCEDRFNKILNSCNTDTTSEKLGGTLTDGCAFYQLTGRAKDVKGGLELKKAGALKCKPT